jgi:tetratricopeptide (TPR) repeat protein
MRALGLIIGLSIVALQAAAQAKSPVEVNRIAKAITVKIYNPSSTNQGSGILLQRQGGAYTVLTAAHVLDGERFIITTPDDRQYQSIVGSENKYAGDIDLAVVKFQSNQDYLLAQLGNSNSLEGGMNLYVSGFPKPTTVISQSVFVFRPGLVTANSNKVFESGYALLYSNDTLPGMSGGPILDENAQLVGVHGKGDKKKGTDIKTGFNAGIPISRFISIAKSLGVKFSVPVVQTKPINNGLKADDYFVAAYQRSENGDVAEALAEYSRAITIDPRYAMAYNNRGILKEEKYNDVAGALADYDRAIAIQPQLATAYHNRGNLKRDHRSDFRGALADYNQAILLDRDYGQAYYNRGFLYKEHFIEADAAINDFRRAAALFRKQDLPENLAEALSQLQELDATE